MPLILGSLYDALINAGAEESLARRAAEEAAQIEARFAALDTRLARIEERLGQTPTKADLAEAKTDLTRYILIGSGFVSAAILVAKFFVS